MLCSLSVRVQHYGCREILPQSCMGHCKGHRLGYRRMPHEYVVHFLWCNLFSTTVDDLSQTACNKEIAIVIQKPLVACPKPGICKGTAVGCRIVLIALEDCRTTHDDL